MIDYNLNNLNPKPSYYALRNLISLLSDKGTPVQAGKLNYFASGGSSDVHHMLMQKRDGSFYLAIWIEAEGFYTNIWQYKLVPSQEVTLLLPSNIESVATSAFDDSGNVTVSTSTVKGGSLVVNVSDKLQIIHIIL